MLIECTLIRDGGTHADIDGTDYHFVPQKDGAHVAEVANDEHAQRFLSITEAYRLYAPVKTKASKKAAAEQTDGEQAPDQAEGQ